MKSSLHITIGFKKGKNFLEKSFHSAPFRLADLSPKGGKGRLKIVIMTSSPGLLNNDDHEINFKVNNHASAEITTQAFNRIFESRQGIRQSVNVCLENNGSLHYLPHPSVPHAGSSFSSETKIHLETEHDLLWGEIITCGRINNGETFCFSKYHSVTSVYIGEKLILKENILLRPEIIDIKKIGHMEGYSHQSALIFLNNSVDMAQVIDECRDILTPVRGISFGVSELQCSGCIIRILGNKGEQLFQLQNDLAALIAEYLPQDQNLNTEKTVNVDRA